MMNIEVMGGVSADHVQGLVELKIVAPDELRSQATEIRLSVAGKTIEQRLPVSSSPISFTLVSHRIPNGTQILECLLLDESNRVLSRSQTDLKIDNSRGIGPKISKELSTREFPIFLNGDLGDELFPAHDESHEIAAPLAGDTDAFREFYEKGFFIAEKLLPDSLTDLASGELDQAVEMGWDGYKLGSSQRMHNMHLKFEGVEKIWLHPEILRKLELFLGAEPMLCQTLTYINGSEQDLHQDTIHLSSFPRGSMIGVWVALEDVQPGSGELEYIVGSHKWPRVYRHHVGCEPVKDCWKNFGELVVGKWKEMAGNNETMPFFAKKGDVLFWHENLMHGGRKRSNPMQTRKSIVSHYFTAGSLVYYDSTASIGYTKHLPRK